MNLGELEPQGLGELVLYQMPDLIASRTDPLHREVSCPAVHKFPASAIGQQPGTRQPSLKSGWENEGPGTWGENKRNPEWAPLRKPTLGLPDKVANSFSSGNRGPCCRYHCRCSDALEPVRTVVPFSRWAVSLLAASRQFWFSGWLLSRQPGWRSGGLCLSLVFPGSSRTLEPATEAASGGARAPGPGQGGGVPGTLGFSRGTVPPPPTMVVKILSQKDRTPPLTSVVLDYIVLALVSSCF